MKLVPDREFNTPVFLIPATAGAVAWRAGPIPARNRGQISYNHHWIGEYFFRHASAARSIVAEFDVLRSRRQFPMMSNTAANNPEPRVRNREDSPFEIDALMNGSIHVWHMELGCSERESRSWDHALGQEDHARASRIRREPARRRFMASRGLLRSLLGRYLQMSPATLAFDLGEYGKPRLAGSKPDLGLVFNASHTEDRMVVALAFDARLGIDIERWRPLGDAAALAVRCFAPSELAHWHRLPESQQLREFFRLWTLKEAFCKAVGRGIGLGLQGCEFDCAATRPRLLSWPAEETGAHRDWFFCEFDGRSGMSGAVACDRLAEHVRHFEWTAPR